MDWECAGFYPEYWEYTELMYGAERFPEIQDIIRDAFTEDSYGEELRANEYHLCSLSTASHRGHFRAGKTEIHKSMSLV